MAYEAPSLATLIDRVRGDIQSAMTYARDGSLRPVPYLLMVLCRDGVGPAAAGLAWGLHQGLAWVSRQLTPLDADGAAEGGTLDAHGATVDRFRRGASPARLSVRVWADAGSVVPDTASVRRADGAAFGLIAGGHTFAVAGYWDTVVQAAVGGAAGNTSAGVILTLVDRLDGVNAAVEVLGLSQAGADAEDDDVYRPDVVLGFQKGAGAGSARIEDWQKWVMEVDGTDRPLVQSPARGVIRIEVIGIGGTTPDEITVEAVRNHLATNYAPADCDWAVEAWTP